MRPEQADIGEGAFAANGCAGTRDRPPRSTRVKRFLCVSVLTIMGCASLERPSGGPSGPEPIAITAAATPLNSLDPSQARVGGLRFAGGLRLTSADRRFGGLSGLDGGYGPLIAVTDRGDFLQLTPVLDDSRRLVGIRDATITRLVDERGQPLGPGASAEAEGLSYTRTGRIAVSFGQSSRILSYGDIEVGEPAIPLLSPSVVPSSSGAGGLHALAAIRVLAPFTVPGAQNGQLWWCFNTQPADAPEPCDGFQLRRDFDRTFTLAGLDLGPLDFGPLYGVFRNDRPGAGAEAVIAELDASEGEDGMYEARALATLSAPLTVGAFEGIVALEGWEDGTIRFYVVSDDDFSGGTLLLAFDYDPSRTPDPAEPRAAAGAPSFRKSFH